MIRNLLPVMMIGAALGLTGCGSDSSQRDTAKTIVKGIFKTRAKAAPTPDRKAVITSALAGSTGPIMLVELESRKTLAVLLRIETNGAYETWASSDRRSLTLRDGLITATRGLGQDIMSSETGASRQLILARKGGTTQRSQNYLNGENQTITLLAKCTVSRGASHRISAGEINTAAVLMTETCQAETTRFDNTYMVDGKGQIIQSRQWLGPLNGYFSLQVLRR